MVEDAVVMASMLNSNQIEGTLASRSPSVVIVVECSAREIAEGLVVIVQGQ